MQEIQGQKLYSPARRSISTQSHPLQYPLEWDKASNLQYSDTFATMIFVAQHSSLVIQTRITPGGMVLTYKTSSRPEVFTLRGKGLTFSLR